MRLLRIVRWLAFLLLPYLAICCAGGVFLADQTLRPPRRWLGEQDRIEVRRWAEGHAASLEEVSIEAADRVVLRGWLIRPDRGNGDAAILLHGLGDNRMGVLGHAQILLASGYTVLLPDARAHGLSGGEIATYGLLERNDIHRWWNFLSAQVHPHCIEGVGESMGAAQLLQSLADGTPFCALLAESSFANFREIAYDRMGQPFHLGPWIGRTILRPLVEAAFLRALWKYRLDMEGVSPEDAVSKSRVPILLVHGQNDRNIPLRHSERIVSRRAGVELWVVPGADHCAAIAVAPEQFQKRLLEWFEPSGGVADRRGR